MKGTDGVVRFRLDAKECVPLTHEEFLDARDHSPSAVVVSLGDGLATVDRFDHGRPESIPRLGGGMLPAHAEYRLDCASLVSEAPSSAKSFDPSDPDVKASADPRGWLESVAKALDLRAPFRVGHAFEGWPCDAAAAAKKIRERDLSSMASKIRDKTEAGAKAKSTKPDSAVLGG